MDDSGNKPKLETKKSRVDAMYGLSRKLLNLHIIILLSGFWLKEHLSKLNIWIIEFSLRQKFVGEYFI